MRSRRGSRGEPPIERVRGFQQRGRRFVFCYQRWEHHTASDHHHIAHAARDHHAVADVSELAHYNGERTDYVSVCSAVKHSYHATGHAHAKERETRRSL